MSRGISRIQIVTASGRFEYVALRKFALPRPNASRAGGPPPEPPASPLTTKKQVDDWYAAGIAGTAGIQPGINRIIFGRAKGTDWRQGSAPGPWENHETNEHLSIVTYGTAKATLDGFITGAHWDNRGVMGKGVVGGTEYTVEPGDLVFVFRPLSGPGQVAPAGRVDVGPAVPILVDAPQTDDVDIVMPRGCDRACSEAC
jgi:hypothetical protein